MSYKKTQQQELAVYHKLHKALEHHFQQTEAIPDENWLAEIAHEFPRGTNCHVTTKVVFQIAMDSGTIILEKEIPFVGDADIRLVFEREGNAPLGLELTYYSSGHKYIQSMVEEETKRQGMPAMATLIKAFYDSPEN
jgi:hypothetical protein